MAATRKTSKKTAKKTTKAKSASTAKKKATTKKTATAKSAAAAKTRATRKTATTEKTATGDKQVTVDRRGSMGRRTNADRRRKNESVAADRRNAPRRKVPRRRQIDPTTCERDYTGDEIEFMSALDKYKRTSGRMFPTCSEVLEVLRNLGYQKRQPGESADPLVGPPVPGLPVEQVSPSVSV